jgi:sucrose-6-phosphate hydrolase SacC (GH32 family)
MKPTLTLLTALLLAPLTGLHAADEDLALNYHLMHPGGDSLPGDPNAAFYLDGTYHLHFILAHPWKKNKLFSFVHVTSPDMLHWTWQPTKLQPSFTGHGISTLVLPENVTLTANQIIQVQLNAK